MTKNEREKVEKHFDELHARATEITANIPDDIRDALKASYLAGADYAIDMFAPRWISVEDALPEEDDLVLVNTLNGKINMIEVAGYDEGKRKFHNWYSYIPNVTHWQPLPAYPISGNQSAVFTPISGNEKGGER